MNRITKRMPQQVGRWTLPTCMRGLRLAVTITAICAVSACSLIQPVQPWEKGTLARQEMTIQGSDPLRAKFSEHIYDSREGASGGAGVGGGGCGCN